MAYQSVGAAGNRIDRAAAISNLNTAVAYTEEAVTKLSEVSSALGDITRQVVVEPGSSWQTNYTNIDAAIQKLGQRISTEMPPLDEAIEAAINSGGAAIADIRHYTHANYPSVSPAEIFTSNSAGVDSYATAATTVQTFRTKINEANMSMEAARQAYGKIATTEGTFQELWDAAHNAAERLRRVSEQWTESAEKFKKDFVAFLDEQKSKSSEAANEVQSMIDNIDAALDFSSISISGWQ